MEDVYIRAFNEIIGIEGGYSDHPDDRGGPTKYGVTRESARAWGYEGDMRNFSLQNARDFYYEEFWTKYRFDEIDDERIQLEIFEQAINMGPNRAVRHLQLTYNGLVESKSERIAEDGIMGPNTLSAINSLQTEEDKECAFTMMNILQGNYYINLVKHVPEQHVFLRGWLKRVKIHKQR